MPSKAKRNRVRKFHFVRAVLALRDDEGHARRAKADPGIETLREARALAQRLHHLDALAVDEAEIAGALRQADLAEALEQAVEEMRRAAA